jgi:hypothetical protein
MMSDSDHQGGTPHPRHLSKACADALAEIKATLMDQDAAADSVAAALLSKGPVPRVRSKVIVITGFAESGKTNIGTTFCRAISGSDRNEYDMLLFKEPASEAPLIGTPNVHVSPRAGHLTAALAKDPGACIFLDDIDAAHPTVQKVLIDGIRNGYLVDVCKQKPVLTTRATFILATQRPGDLMSLLDGLLVDWVTTNAPTPETRSHTFLKYIEKTADEFGITAELDTAKLEPTIRILLGRHNLISSRALHRSSAITGSTAFWAKP